MKKDNKAAVLKGEMEKDLDSFYKMTYEIEKEVGSSEKQARELAARVRFKMEKKLKIYSQPIKAVG